MLWSLMLAAAVVAAAPGPVSPSTVTMVVDSSKHELTITAGPFDLPNMPPMDDHAMMTPGMSHDVPVQRFAWPVDGWFRGFRVAVTDAQGTRAPSPRLASPHHGQLQPAPAASTARPNA